MIPDFKDLAQIYQQRALESLSEEDLAHAKRYRWLREKAAPQWRNGPGLYWYLPRFMDGTPQEKLDAAIDAAMKEKK